MQNAIKMKTSTRNPKNCKWAHPNDKDGQILLVKKGSNQSDMLDAIRIIFFMRQLILGMSN